MRPEITVRRLEPHDHEQTGKLVYSRYLEQESHIGRNQRLLTGSMGEREFIRNLFHNQQDTAPLRFVACEGDKIVGYLGSNNGLFHPYLSLDHIAVDKAYENKGVATKLLLKMSEAAKAGQYEHFVALTPNLHQSQIESWKRQGWKITPTYKHADTHLTASIPIQQLQRYLSAKLK